MEDRYMTTTELAERLKEKEDRRVAKRNQELTARYGLCLTCRAPRTEEKTSDPGRSRLVCTADPGHPQWGGS